MSSDRHFDPPYPGYDVLDKWDSPSWDDVTRRTVARRMYDVPRRQFFTPHEWDLLQAMVDRLLPQPERGADAVPIVPWIDEKLANRRGRGFRYEDMPPMAEEWRLALAGIDQESRRRFGRPFLELGPRDRDSVLKAVQDGEVEGKAWHRLPAQRFFSATLMPEIVLIYYAHPTGWSEIGFGGPASPRGYVRHQPDSHDPWEAPPAKELPQRRVRRR